MAATMRSIVLSALLAASLAANAAAQQIKPIANWDNLNQLAAGAEVRVTLTTGSSVHGFVQRVTPESLILNATTSQESLSRPDIRRVALKKAGHRGRNTLLGFGIGKGAGLVTDRKSVV